MAGFPDVWGLRSHVSVTGLSAESNPRSREGDKGNREREVNLRSRREEVEFLEQNVNLQRSLLKNGSPPPRSGPAGAEQTFRTILLDQESVEPHS